MSILLQRYENNGIELVINTQTGESFATISGYARMAGKAKSTISKRLGSLELEEAEILTATGIKTVDCIPVKIVLDWLTKDNPNAIHLVIEKVWELTGKRMSIPSFSTKNDKKYKSPEKIVQKRLAKSLNGKIEVQCKTGSIDVLTDTEIIEVKKARDWKHAVGQVIVYHLEYPSCQPRIHLYEKCSDEFKSMVISYCSRLNIVATFES